MKSLKEVNAILKEHKEELYEYFGINYKIVWKVIKERLPEIKPIIRKILKQLDE